MLDLVAIAFVVGGIALLVAGATLSKYGVAAVGVAVGGGAGYLAGPTVAAAVGLASPLGTAAGVLGGAVVGVVVTYLLLSVAVAAITFLVGTYAGFVLVVPAFVDGAWYVQYPAAVAVGVVAALAALVLTRTAMVFVSSFLGAALATRALTPGDFSTARTALEVDPLVFDATDPLFVLAFVFGALVQIGLVRLGWAKKILGLLPGPGSGSDRPESGEATDR